MARNRKRARDRRGRQGDEISSLASAGEPDLDDAGDELLNAAPEREQATDPLLHPSDDIGEAPDPLRHASPDVELADLQVALGRPELSRQADGDDDLGDLYDDEFDEAGEDELAGSESGGDAFGGAAGGGRSGAGGAGRPGAGGSSGGGELALPSGVTERRAPPGSRLINFLHGSWRELQRVQWPDRRQVMQATGVVLGFVIVAGVYLGLADYVAQKVVNLILK